MYLNLRVIPTPTCRVNIMYMELFPIRPIPMCASHPQSTTKQKARIDQAFFLFCLPLCLSMHLLLCGLDQA